jgi:heme/copper-type cytochrome/quinol oxidase subunit 2
MRVALLGVCALLALGVFAAMLLGVGRRHEAPDAQPGARRGLALELVWAVIPCLMVIAAVMPAAIKILETESGR